MAGCSLFREETSTRARELVKMDSCTASVVEHGGIGAGMVGLGDTGTAQSQLYSTATKASGMSNRPKCCWLSLHIESSTNASIAPAFWFLGTTLVLMQLQLLPHSLALLRLGVIAGCTNAPLESWQKIARGVPQLLWLMMEALSGDDGIATARGVPGIGNVAGGIVHASLHQSECNIAAAGRTDSSRRMQVGFGSKCFFCGNIVRLFLTLDPIALIDY
mmetsp:Transcript_1138/g.2676  ORF Transcript_1138/g.2676 Transcript_1138/m.2676 type:complete len:218 (+) Transcript_1138:302-955(+)